jgi:hypothetical protein
VEGLASGGDRRWRWRAPVELWKRAPAKRKIDRREEKIGGGWRDFGAHVE